MFYLKTCNNFSNSYLHIFEVLNEKVFNIRLWVKTIRKASTYLTEEPKKSPLILLLDHDLW